MNGWQRWLIAPSTHFLHKILFQLHLWLGIGFGLYLLLISVSGSAVVLRPWMARWFASAQVEQAGAVALTGRELEQRIALVYAGYQVQRIVQPGRPAFAVYVALERDGEEQSRYFDPYQGRDLGPTFPWQLQTVEWLTRFHDELLLGRPGQTINGLGGALLVLMVLSGLLIWWRGSRSWQRGLIIERRSARSLLWQLHGCLGFWSALLLLVWGLTAMYFAWPGPVEALIDRLDSNPDDFERPDSWLRTLVQLHFGRFREHMWLTVLWMVLGLLPALMFITGAILWYRRVLKPAAGKH